LWIAAVLGETGYEYFLQDHHIDLGDNILERTRPELEKARHIIAVLSPDYLHKDHTKREMIAACSRDPAGTKRTLLIIRGRDCEIPVDLAALVYLDLRERNEQAKRMLLAKITGERPSVRAGYSAFTAKLPTVDPTLIGREEQLAFLDRAWSDPATNFVQIIAAGGTGKTALADKWFRRHLDEATVFGWSFYGQGTSDNRQTSSDLFFAEILTFFDITVPATGSIYAKAEAIARRLREERVPGSSR